MKSMRPVNLRIVSIYSLIGIALFLLPAGASTHPENRPVDADMVMRIDAALDVPELRSGFQGLLIQSLSDGSVWYERNADHVFLPASNNKLLTSGAALGILGHDFVYRTRLLHTGNLDRDGSLQGDLILQGAGDPILTPADLLDLARQAHKAGLKHLKGHFYYDDNLFDHQRLGDTWAWDDEPYYYSAQISALNLNENLIELRATPGDHIGAPVRIAVSPAPEYIVLSNTATTGPAQGKSTLVFDRLRGQNTITVSGSLPIDARAPREPTAVLTIEDPSRFTALVCSRDLALAGITLDEIAPSPLSSLARSGTVIAEHVSPPLSAVLKRLNKPSDNLIAECLLKTVGAVKTGQGTGGADGTGARSAREFFKGIGLDPAELHQADGSGLSRTNFVSPRNLVRLLTYLHGRDDFAVLYDSLPIAGVDGSLAGRMRNTAAANNCHAKTGYESNVSSLSGYVTTRNGEMLVFSILMNNHLSGNRACVAIQDRIIQMLADYKRMP